MAKKSNKRVWDSLEVEGYEQNEAFYFIVGFTSDGAPYGITWDEAYADGLIDEGENIDSETDCKLSKNVRKAFDLQFEEGMKFGEKDVIKQLISNDISLERIAELTGLPIERIKEIQKI